jgi:hypothetical protein
MLDLVGAGGDGYRGHVAGGESLRHAECAVREATPPVDPSSPDGARSPASQLLGKLPLAFIENRGQVDECARFSARCDGMTVYFTDGGLVIHLVTGALNDRATRPFD